MVDVYTAGGYYTFGHRWPCERRNGEHVLPTKWHFAKLSYAILELLIFFFCVSLRHSQAD